MNYDDNEEGISAVLLKQSDEFRVSLFFRAILLSFDIAVQERGQSYC